MENPKASKNKEYVKKYRQNQKALGRRARLLFLTDDEFEAVKQTVYNIRVPNSENN